MDEIKEFLISLGYKAMGDTWYCKWHNCVQNLKETYCEFKIVIKLRNYEGKLRVTIRKWCIHTEADEIGINTRREYLFQGTVETAEELNKIMEQINIK